MDKILIIEDDDLIRENMQELFSNEGYSVDVAINGKIGLQIAKDTIPDLIVSDIMMPEMDGYQVFKNLREDPLLSVIPFIFLSALSDKKNLRIGMSLGADDFITKPFINAELLEAVKNRIHKSKIIKKSMEDLRLNLVRSVPHEFFTPLNSILGFSQLMIDSCNDSMEILPEEILEFSQQINLAGKNLLRLTKNYVYFTELSLLESDSPMYRIFRDGVSKNIKGFLSDYILEVAKQRNREKEIELHILESNIKISEKYLKKIFEELIDNAVKFSDKNTRIIVNVISDDAFAKISVEDFGIGMDEQELLRLGLFVQLDRKKFEQPGIGLGLSIVKKIVDLSQGTFFIESTKGKGTKIEIKIPIGK